MVIDDLVNKREQGGRGGRGHRTSLPSIPSWHLSGKEGHWLAKSSSRSLRAPDGMPKSVPSPIAENAEKDDEDARGEENILVPDRHPGAEQGHTVPTEAPPSPLDRANGHDSLSTEVLRTFWVCVWL